MPDTTFISDGRPHPESTEHALCRLWQRVLGASTIGIDDNFFSIGGDSFTAMRMVAAARSELSLNLNMQTLLENPTIRGLAQVQAMSFHRETGCLIPLSRTGQSDVAYCFHAVAGTLTRYSALASRLSDRFNVYGLQARGLRPNETPHRTIEKMASEYLDAIRINGDTGPYIFIGYSLGGLIAYETARQARASGADVRALVLIDALANPSIDNDPAYAIRSLVQNALRLELDPEQLLRLAVDDRAEVIRREAIRAGALPADCDAVRVQRMLRTYDVVRDAARAYVAHPEPLDILFFRASNEPRRTPDQGWGRLVRRVTVHDIAADHYHITDNEHATEIAATIRRIL